MSLVEPGFFNTPLNESEVLTFLEKRRGLIDGVTITGGEPFLHRDLTEWLEGLKKMGFMVKIDTNGSFAEHLNELMISAYPPDYIAMDVKMPTKSYDQVGATEEDIRNIERSIRILRKFDGEHEFRITLWDKNSKPEDIHAIGKMVQGAHRVVVQQLSQKSEIYGQNMTLGPHQIVEILKGYVRTCVLR